MADMTAYLQSAAIGTQVARSTGAASDGFKAGGYAAFIDAITGQPPQVITQSDGRIVLAQSPEQNRQIAQWTETQMLDSFFHRKPAGKISYEIGPALLPVAVKYAVPVAAVLFAAGYIVRGLLK